VADAEEAPDSARALTAAAGHRMPIRSILLMGVCVVLITAGQLMLKSAATQWRFDELSWGAARGFFSPIMIAALALYGIATLLWVYVLRTVPLSSAYATFALAFVIVLLVAHFVLGEPLSANALIGGAIIVVGVVVAVR
jgi:drug/metabolite transporter (DMT)-like permease